ELLWQLGRVAGIGVTPDGRNVIYKVSTPNLSEDKGTSKIYSIPIQGGPATEIPDTKILPDASISPDGKYKLFAKDVKLKNVLGKDLYPDLPKSNARVYESLNYRHWDEWEDGAFSHLFYSAIDGSAEVDLLPNEPFDCPQKPFGDEADYKWSPDGKKVIYVAKKKFGTSYAVSTNSDLYQFDIA